MGPAEAGFLERAARREGGLVLAVAERGFLVLVGALLGLLGWDRAAAAVLDVMVDGAFDDDALCEESDLGMGLGLGSRRAIVFWYFCSASLRDSMLAIHSFPWHSGS